LDFLVVSFLLASIPNNLYVFFFLTICATCPAHLILLDLIILILGEEYKSQSSSLCSFLHIEEHRHRTGEMTQKRMAEGKKKAEKYVL
jgi:hypothetical protein